MPTGGRHPPESPVFPPGRLQSKNNVLIFPVFLSVSLKVLMEMVPCEEEDLPLMKVKLFLSEIGMLLTWFLSVNQLHA